MLVTGVSGQLPVKPVGSDTTTTLDPCRAPPVTLGLTMGAAPATVKLQRIVDVAEILTGTSLATRTACLLWRWLRPP
jgi:hypothetical protein